jgi:hypothetical protein
VKAIRHGYTLHDLDEMARIATLADRSLAMDYATRRDIAWSAIAEALVTSDEPPARHDLIRAGSTAIYQEIRTTASQRGRPRDAYEFADKAHTPRFALFWQDYAVTPSPEGRIVEHLAVRQCLDVLSQANLEALEALAVHGDYQRAALALGLDGAAFRARLVRARRQVLAVWFEGETPRTDRRTDRRAASHSRPLATHCSNGHEWTPENTRIQHGMRNGRPRRDRVCLACQRDREARRGPRPARKAAA